MSTPQALPPFLPILSWALRHYQDIYKVSLDFQAIINAPDFPTKMAAFEDIVTTLEADWADFPITPTPVPVPTPPAPTPPAPVPTPTPVPPGPPLPVPPIGPIGIPLALGTMTTAQFTSELAATRALVDEIEQKMQTIDKTILSDIMALLSSPAFQALLQFLLTMFGTPTP